VAQILAGGWPYEVLAGGQFQPVPMGQAAQAVLPFSERRRLDATHHEAGTLWMGDDPNTSVTNSKGRFHHITNAYALGPCLFPTIGARDPWLTSTALACCLVDHLLGRQTGPPAAAYHAGSPLCDNSGRMRTARAREE
jgi:choline dehydrogenase-like flavoprotein